ncbi:hypothetical protein [Paraburkholderia tropica]|uniref:hypothetical protein n=1 Tax=Paraburkholderia tropica TaxID=92647 RepID=UPI0007ECB673|nr:hypothetical protein [Paraburkholderia tropica]
MSSLPNVSLADYYDKVKHNPVTRNMVRLQYVQSYAEFIEIFYELLDYAIDRLQENPQHHQEDSEDALTVKLMNLLEMAGLSVTTGTTGGGNKDLTVRGLNPEWSWIGEAKKFNSLTDVREGFLQLTTRYRTANPLYARAGLIAYTLRPRAAQLLKDWMEAAPNVANETAVKLENFRVEECKRRPGLAFNSFHTHVASGLECEIRHVAVVLYHLPEDKSGRTAKKHQRARDAASGVDATPPPESNDGEAAAA